MIVYGWRVRESSKETGNFYCPQCGSHKDYDRMQLRKWFTLYWIPIFPFSTEGEYVKCQCCRSAWQPTVLSLQAP
jgi:hypothetical protein